MNHNHIIKTQILDFTLATQESSFIFQNELGTLYYDEIVPLIEDYFDSLNNSSEIHRIDRLEIDLGNVRSNNLRYDTITKIAEKFSTALKNKMLPSSDHFYAEKEHSNHTYNSISPDNRNKDLLEFFLKKGRLPWWIKKDELINIPEILESLLGSNPSAIKDIMSMMKENHTMLERIVNQFNDDILARILNISSGSETTAAIIDIIIVSRDSTAIKSFGAPNIRSTIWKYVLTRYFDTTQDNSATHDLLHSITTHLAETFQADYKQLYADLAGKLECKEYQSDKTVCTEPLKSKNKTDITGNVYHNKNKQNNSFNESLETIQNTLQALIIPDDKNKLDTSLKAAIEHFEIKLIHVIKLVHNNNHRIKNDSIAREKAVTALFESLFELLRQNIPNKEKESIRLAVQTLVATLNNTPEQIDAKTIEVKDNYRFSDTEEIYVNNAGIVLFWPYINRLFEQCGLVKDKRFIDKEKQNHAVFLLQYLSTGKDEAPEYKLILNKILCGLHPDFPVHEDTGITKTESIECTNLTDSLIQNWPALKSMSVQGLRDTFVTRDAMIYSRDGHYVMRVEEKGYDVLIDKMPWSLGTIKLPWMDDILFVEWRL